MPLSDEQRKEIYTYLELKNVIGAGYGGFDFKVFLDNWDEVIDSDARTKFLKEGIAIKNEELAQPLIEQLKTLGYDAVKI